MAETKAPELTELDSHFGSLFPRTAGSEPSIFRNSLVDFQHGVFIFQHGVFGSRDRLFVFYNKPGASNSRLGRSLNRRDR